MRLCVNFGMLFLKSVFHIVCADKKEFLQDLLMHIFNEVAYDLAELLEPSIAWQQFWKVINYL